jgi:hypothetical protein
MIIHILFLRFTYLIILLFLLSEGIEPTIYTLKVYSFSIKLQQFLIFFEGDWIRTNVAFAPIYSRLPNHSGTPSNRWRKIGIEPIHHSTKNYCLTIWLLPQKGVLNLKIFIFIFHFK